MADFPLQSLHLSVDFLELCGGKIKFLFDIWMQIGVWVLWEYIAIFLSECFLHVFDYFFLLVDYFDEFFYVIGRWVDRHWFFSNILWSSLKLSLRVVHELWSHWLITLLNWVLPLLLLTRITGSSTLLCSQDLGRITNLQWRFTVLFLFLLLLGILSFFYYLFRFFVEFLVLEECLVAQQIFLAI